MRKSTLIEKLHSKMSLSGRLLTVGLVIVSFVMSNQSSLAQKAKPAASSAAKHWTTRCTSVKRAGPLNCSMEQRVILRSNGRQIAKMEIRVPSVGKPALLIQLPLGLSMLGGIALQIDKNKPIKLAIQTCEASGCYAAIPVSPTLISTLKRGRKMSIAFQNNQKKDITIPIVLSGIGAAYDSIK